MYGSTDTPGPSSTYALRLQRDTVNKVVPGLTTTAIAKSADVSSKYRVGVWAKGKGTLLVRQRTPDGPKSEVYYFNSTVWSYYGIDSFTPRPTADTLSFTFRPFDIDPVPFLLIDNVSVTYYRWN